MSRLIIFDLCFFRHLTFYTFSNSYNNYFRDNCARLQQSSFFFGITHFRLRIQIAITQLSFLFKGKNSTTKIH